MNAPIPPIWTTGSTEVFKTGTWRAALPLHVHAPSPCHQACPVGGEIAEREKLLVTTPERLRDRFKARCAHPVVGRSHRPHRQEDSCP